MRALFNNLVACLVGFSSVALANNPEFIPVDESTMVAEIVSGQVDFLNDEIVLDVRFGGGCQEHNFTLIKNGCSIEKSSCALNLIQFAGFEDLCRSIVQQELRFPVDPQYAEMGELIIYGAGQSKAVVSLREEHRPVAVINAEYAQKEKEMVIDVRYVGGCAEHKFELNVEDCNHGVCVAKFEQVSGSEDHCKSIVEDSIRIPVNFDHNEVSAVKIIDGFDSSVYVELFN